MDRTTRRLLMVLAIALLGPACGSGKPGPKPPPPPAPPAPTSLAASPGTTRMDLTWTNATPDQTAVVVERSADAVTFFEIVSLSGTAAAYTDQGLFPGSTYYYRVRAWNGVSAGPYSASAGNTTSPPAWSLITPGPPNPTGRTNVGVANAVGSNLMIIAAGDDSSFPPTNTQTWAFKYSGTGSPSWSSQGAGPNPGVRSYPGMAYDPGNQRVLLMGGLDLSNPVSPVFRNDVWALTQTSPGVWDWAPVSTVGVPPPGLCGHTVVMAGSKMYVFGGQNDAPFNNLMNDLWILDFAPSSPTWSHVSKGPLDARAFHVAVLDTVSQRMVVFGGFDGVNYRNDTWALNLSGFPAWTALYTASTPPYARGSMSAVFDAAARMMIVFGGNSPSSSNDLWMLSLSGTPVWQLIPATGTPPGIRGGHAAVFEEATGRMILFGGQDFMGGTLYPDVWRLQF